MLKPMSGYDLKKKLLETFDYNISFGTLYPHLRSLESSKLIIGRWLSKKPRKRLYSVTYKGRESLSLSTKQISQLLQLMSFTTSSSSSSEEK